MKFILMILLIINTVIVIQSFEKIEQKLDLNYEAMICLEDPNCTLE